MHDKFTAAAQRQTIDRRDHRHHRVFDAHRGGLEFGDHAFKLGKFLRLQGFECFGQIGPHRVRRFVPDHHRLVFGFRPLERLQHAVEHFLAERMHFGFERHNGDVLKTLGGPHAHAIGFKDGAARVRFFAQ